MNGDGEVTSNAHPARAPFSSMLDDLPPLPAPAELPDDPLWYKDAIIYEMHVRAFQDSNGDGIGDI